MTLGILDRRRVPARLATADDVLWGVRRRLGYSEFDDPAAHAGMRAHAYLIDDDSEALCGFRSLRSGQRRFVPLAAATDGTPCCRACLAGITVAVPVEPDAPGEFVDAAGDWLAFAAREVNESPGEDSGRSFPLTMAAAAEPGQSPESESAAGEAEPITAIPAQSRHNADKGGRRGHSPRQTPRKQRMTGARRARRRKAAHPRS